MRLSLSRSVGSANVAPRPSRRPLVVTKASIPEDIAAGFAQIFTPLRSNNKEDWTGTDTPFTGKVTPHSEARKPFKDGWQGEAPAKEAAAAAAEPATEDNQEPSPKDTVLTFLHEATQNVVAHNFTGDATEPETWKGKGEKTPSGWKGDIHTKGRDGFHNV